MLSVHLICVGKLKEPFYKDACAEYAKRLSAYCRLTVTELPEEKLPKDPSPAQIDAALAKEAAAIRGKIPPSSRVAALCIEGRMRSSQEMAQLFPALGHSPDKHMVFLIGGSYGLHPTVKAQAHTRLSMSPMTFPHHLARVMLLEQIYRGFQINAGGSYHK
ncbi:23S rRNA (pseudouridine(1915)-N(3))-methyltransferase RlmH [Pseudoflavonifractor sp. 524-17]|uniref:23S rRNA (pseudouridine(1915)-N(3))-methyltransferase RlmH n=1 Tax=Pseudoflavonifractor sp. 524-17 TaxID=2304577 RepID=UPI0013796AAC|nr:23S rRNA (pseudouridine(1915)-N(3))-methyltransferase RlmH [Pseudoflavonifractor sp. 524-17]